MRNEGLNLWDSLFSMQIEAHFNLEPAKTNIKVEIEGKIIELWLKFWSFQLINVKSFPIIFSELLLLTDIATNLAGFYDTPKPSLFSIDLKGRFAFGYIFVRKEG